MELINAIAAYFNEANSMVTNITVTGKHVWFNVGATEYSCTLTRGKYLKSNSIRKV